ncbi:MAG: T9SS type A sorting domain-containing protein [Balneola sp.]
MKKIIFIIGAMVLLPLATNAQNWSSNGIFPADSSFSGGTHGVTVAGDGKVWSMDRYTTGSLRRDSSVSVVDIRVFNPDGTEADFSPVQEIEVDGDTVVFSSASRGIGVDANGDILYTDDRSFLVRINHLTGEGMDRVNPGLGPLTNPTSDANGNIYVSAVLSGRPVLRYDADMDTTDANGEAVIADLPAIGRALAVSRDGNTIYAPRFTINSLLVYERANALVPFGDADTVLRNSDIESIAVDPFSGNVWASASHYLRPDSVRFITYKPNVWYGFDPETFEKVDSVEWEFYGEDPFGPDPEFLPGNQVPRGVAFGDLANDIYIGSFRNDGTAFPPLQSFTRVTRVSNEDDFIGETPEGFKLEQNYPNPFNPSTNINYSLQQSSNVVLKVYDITGREIATLVNERVSAGANTVTFDASNLASGVYIYTLQANGLLLTKRMTLIK